MSQYPPQTPGEDPLSYNSAGPKTSGMAITSMVLGIVSIPLMCIWGAGILTAIPAIILGIIAMSSINKNPQQATGKGMAIAGIATGAGSFLVIAAAAAILIPSLGKARELSNRSVCAANMRGISQSMNLYAADNNDNYPIVSPTGGYSLAAGGTGTPGGDRDITIASLYKAPQPSVTQNMWLLVMTGQVAPKQFQCKSDPASKVDALEKMGGAYQVNFNDGHAASDYSYSYSFAYPWTQSGKIGGWWRNQTDASLPVIGDMAPLAGTGSPAAAPDSKTKNANSFNHQRDGENIAYGDGHAEFQRMPAVGQGNDNVYTMNGGRPDSVGSAFNGGAVPGIGEGGSAGAYDVILVPVADGNAKYMRK